MATVLVNLKVKTRILEAGTYKSNVNYVLYKK